MNVLIACLRAVLNFFSEIVFGCNHARVTRPFTLGEQTYKVCLDCGKQIYYSAQEMRPLTPWEIRRMKAAHTGELRVVPVPTGPQLLLVQERKSNIAA